MYRGEARDAQHVLGTAGPLARLADEDDGVAQRGAHLGGVFGQQVQRHVVGAVDVSVFELGGRTHVQHTGGAVGVEQGVQGDGGQWSIHI